MHLGETIATYDVALALRGESGKFEVTSPTSEIFHVTCKPNQSISNLEWAGSKTVPQPFLIRKIAEPVSLAEGKGTTSGTIEGAAQALPGRAPFLLENQREETKTSSDADKVASLPKPLDDDFHSPEVANFDFLYWESDPGTKQHSACVGLKNGHLDQPGEAEKLLTSVCTNFNDFDAEIRRLHARLDEIRYQARKKFHLAQAVAAGA